MSNLKSKRAVLDSDPFHSDDASDPMLRALRNLAPQDALLFSVSGAVGGPADQTGRFTYLFPELVSDPTSILPTDESGEMLPSITSGLEVLATGMNAVSGNSTIPAGFTYLGQFIDHDITFDPTSSLARLNDPNTVRNFRTPGLNLDSLYGGGPNLAPYLYDGNKLRIGGHALGRDLPRAIKTSPAEGDRNDIAKAIIGDPRNDENLIVAQVHCAFIAFHNKVVDLVVAEASTPAELIFTESARRVRWHYQWIIVNQFLPSFLRIDILDDVKANGNKFYTPGVNSVTMPVEFSMAAYRFGHSLIREDYNFNANFRASTLEQLFIFTGNKIPSVWEKAEWREFFQFGTRVPANFAQLVDAKITNFMHSVPTPGGPVSVPRNNLKRGYAFSLPTGQAVAKKLGVAVLTEAEVSQVGGVELPSFTANPIFKQRTPLWYYILKESEVKEAGARLGAVGSRIVAEVFFGLLRADRTSYLNSPLGSAWVPTLPPVAAGTPAGDFRITDLIVHAGHALADGSPT